MGGRLEGRVAVITGGASGIGAATARRFTDEGARVVLGDLKEEEGRALALELGEAARFRSTDVTDPDALTALVADAVDGFGRLDVMVNNAGIGSFGLTPDLAPEAWRHVIDVDLHAVFYGCRAAIPELRRAGGGSIVNTASISGLFGDHGFAAYNAAKGAVVNYTRALAVDHGHEGIRANAVCPGPIATPLARIVVEHPATRAEYERAIPAGRVGQAEEVASVVAFLASDEASYVSGAAIPIDGGLTAHTGQPNFTRHFTGG